MMETGDKIYIKVSEGTKLHSLHTQYFVCQNYQDWGQNMFECIGGDNINLTTYILFCVSETIKIGSKIFCKVSVGTKSLATRTYMVFCV